MISKDFECEECGAKGRIVIKDGKAKAQTPLFCPICASDIFEYTDDDELDI